MTAVREIMAVRGELLGLDRGLRIVRASHAGERGALAVRDSGAVPPRSRDECGCLRRRGPGSRLRAAYGLRWLRHRRGQRVAEMDGPAGTAEPDRRALARVTDGAIWGILPGIGGAMTISDINRSRFQLIGRDRLSLALATGTIQTLGINEQSKGEALEWLQEQDAENAAAQRLERTRYETIRRWTIVAAVASVLAAVTGTIALFR